MLRCMYKTLAIPSTDCGVWPQIWVVALLLGGLVACAGRTPIDAPPIGNEPLPPAEEAIKTYRMQVNDLLEVKFWNLEELDTRVRVRPDGKISLPYVDDVPAAGLTPQELDDTLVDLYSSELANPEITVIVAETGARVYVGGEVPNEGPVPLTGRLTLLQAVQSAGGFLTTARRREILLIRRPPDGEPVARSIDLRKVLSGEVPQADLTLENSDIVFVPRTKIANVNLFVQQYINQIIPVQGIATGIALESFRGNSDSNNNND